MTKPDFDVVALWVATLCWAGFLGMIFFIWIVCTK